MAFRSKTVARDGVEEDVVFTDIYKIDHIDVYAVCKSRQEEDALQQHKFYLDIYPVDFLTQNSLAITTENIVSNGIGKLDRLTFLVEGEKYDQYFSVEAITNDDNQRKQEYEYLKNEGPFLDPDGASLFDFTLWIDEI